MGKRGGLLRVAMRSHGPGLDEHSVGSSKIRKSKKSKQQPSHIAVAAAKAAAMEDDDMFAMALPVNISVFRTKKRSKSDTERIGEREASDADHAANQSKQDLFEQILANAKAAAPSDQGCRAMEHRKQMDLVKAQKAERLARKHERFHAHKKC